MPVSKAITVIEGMFYYVRGEQKQRTNIDRSKSWASC